MFHLPQVTQLSGGYEPTTESPQQAEAQLATES